MSSEERIIVVNYWLSEHCCSIHTPHIVKEQGISSAVNSYRKLGKKVICVGYNGIIQKEKPEIPKKEENKESYLEIHEDHQILVEIPYEIAEIHFKFCKMVLWQLFHYMQKQSQAEVTQIPEWYIGYKIVNELFSKKIASIFKEGDIIIINDYHLMLVPLMLRNMIYDDTEIIGQKEKQKNIEFSNNSLSSALIGFFLHIPWPSSELYRTLPMRIDLLNGLLASNVIGFQTFSYARHFLSACTRLLGLPINDKGVEVSYGHFVRTEVFSFGIDPNYCFEIMNKHERMNELKKTFDGKLLIVSKVVIDPISGIKRQLKAFKSFLSKFPEYIGKVIWHQECTPNIEKLNEPDYIQFCEEIDQLIGSINGKFGTISYIPIHYINKNLPLEELYALFGIADLAVITPIRDGMNIICQEFIMTQKEKNSPLILSEFVGAAQCLSGAILINPWDEKKFVEAIYNALNLNKETKKMTYKYNYDYIINHDSIWWLNSFINILKESFITLEEVNNQLKKIKFDDIIKAYKKSNKRLLLFDYDGTLSSITKTPNQAIPSKEILLCLEKLSYSNKNQIYIISGRERDFLENWFGYLKVGLSCEHGSFFKPCPKNLNEETTWENLSEELDLSWKDSVYSILKDFTDRTPGSFIEKKEIDFTWHYRNADPEFANHQKKDLIFHLQNLPKLPIDILIGKMAIEIRPQGINKGFAVRKILNTIEKDIDFILCVGDDVTDEDMFEEIKKNENKFIERQVFNIVIGKKKQSFATFYIDHQKNFEMLLKKLSEIEN